MNAETKNLPATNPIPAEAVHAAAELIALGPNATLKDVVAKVNEIIAKVNVKRDRGPDSTRTMTEDDAKRILLGDLKDASHTKAAEALGLSYGQIYSARKGFTFKTIYKEANKK